MLTLLPGDRTLFAFDDEYLGDPERPMLSLSFKDRFGGIVAEQAPTRVRVPPFFSNLLPEGHLREYLAARAGVKDGREFFLLQVLGKDLPGAVVVESDAEEARPPPSPRDGHDDRGLHALRRQGETARTSGPVGDARYGRAFSG